MCVAMMIVISKLFRQSTKEHLSLLKFDEYEQKPKLSSSATAISDLPSSEVPRKRTKTEDTYT